jgi:hypothetical protein
MGHRAKNRERHKPARTAKRPRADDRPFVVRFHPNPDPPSAERRLAAEEYLARILARFLVESGPGERD